MQCCAPRYFSVQTLSGVGLRVTTMKISFNLFYDLLPQHTVQFIAPREFNFGKVSATRTPKDPADRRVKAVTYSSK